MTEDDRALRNMARTKRALARVQRGLRLHQGTTIQQAMMAVMGRAMRLGWCRLETQKVTNQSPGVKAEPITWVGTVEEDS